MTALHYAAKHGAVDVIDQLVRGGATVDAMNGHGNVGATAVLATRVITHPYRRHDQFYVVRYQDQTVTCK